MTNELVKRRVPTDLIFSQRNLVDADSTYFGEVDQWQDVPLITFEPLCQSLCNLKNGGDAAAYADIERKRQHPASIEDADIARFAADRDGLKRELFERMKAAGERATPAAVERQLTDEHEIPEARAVRLTGDGEHRQRDRQIESASLLR